VGRISLTIACIAWGSLASSACGRIGFESVEAGGGAIGDGVDPDAGIGMDAVSGGGGGGGTGSTGGGDGSGSIDGPGTDSGGVADGGVDAVADGGDGGGDAAMDSPRDAGGVQFNDDWLHPDWAYRKRMTIGHAGVPDADQANFPVVVASVSADWMGPGLGHVEQDDGGDFVFTLDDGTTRLDHEIERYVPATGGLVAWVKVPLLSACADTVVYVYYGNAGGGDQWNAAATWDGGGDNHFRGVWHMQASGLTDRPDSSGNGNHATPQGYDGDEATEGKLAGADSLDGVDDELNAGQGESLNIRDALTMSIWVNLPARPAKDKWFNGPWKAGSYSLYIAGIADDVTQLGTFWGIDDTGNDLWNEGVANVPPAVWTHLALTYDGIDLRSYVNGQLDFTKSLPGTIDDSSGVDLTVSRKEGGAGNFDGIIDEMRVSSVARSPEWLATCVNNQRDPASFYTLGAEEPR